MDYAYTFGQPSTVYLNVTNRCTNRCSFCVGRYAAGLGSGRQLRGGPEPGLAEVLAAVSECREREGIDALEEVVWCGFGEPTFRLDLILAASPAFRREGARVRLNTNGQACLIHGRDVLPELGEAVDAVSVSLNAPTRERYLELCSPDPAVLGLGGRPGQHWDALIDFLRRAPRHVRAVQASVVAAALDDAELAACEALASELGCSTLRLR